MSEETVHEYYRRVMEWHRRRLHEEALALDEEIMAAWRASRHPVEDQP